MPWKLLFRNVLGHPVRSLLTIGSVAVAVFLICMLHAVTSGLTRTLSAAASNRLVVQSAVSLFVDLPLSYRDVKRTDRQGMVADILDRFNIVGKKDLYPNQLSGGQQQLVAIARAVVANPSIILADEPTGNLHSDQGRAIMELFATLNAQGTTIVQVTHSGANAAFGRRIIQLKDGWVVDAV